MAGTYEAALRLEQCCEMLLELERETKASGAVPIGDKHVLHLKVSAKALLQRHGSEAVVSVALPPLVCRERYHYAHLDVRRGTFAYRGVASTEYPGTVGAVLEADVVEDGRYYAEEAQRYAREHWGDVMRSAEAVSVQSRVTSEGQLWKVRLAGDEVYETRCRLEAREFLHGKSDGEMYGRRFVPM